MQNATITVVLGETALPLDLGPLSQTAAERNLHLNVLLLGETPAIPVFSIGIGEFSAYSLPDDWQERADKVHAALEDRRKKVSLYLSDQGASAEVRGISADASGLAAAVARASLTCDLILLGNDLRSDAQRFTDLVQAALFETSAGVLLNSVAATHALQPRSVFVAWKAGIPATRAIRAALPLLRGADEVTIALFDPVSIPLRDGENPGSDVAAWLNHHGCEVTVQQYPSSGEDIGEVIAKRAKECGADLIVMGAYDHSRLRETIFGGTTRSLIEQRSLPVLLCH
jgi:nucleotide-binding universal stress UspA family protein